MHQRIGVDRLDRQSRAHRGATVYAIDRRRGDQQQGPQPLAAANRGITHCLYQPGAGIIGDRQQNVEAAVDILGNIAQRAGEQAEMVRNRCNTHAAGSSKGAVAIACPSAPATIFSIRTVAASSRA